MQSDTPETFDWQKIDDLILAGKPISAVNLYRSAKGVDLRRAYEAINTRVEQLFATLIDRFAETDLPARKRIRQS